MDYIIDCTSIVVITRSARFRTCAEVVRVASAVVVAIGKCSGTCAVALDYIIDGARISIIARGACFRTSANVIRVAGAVVVCIGEGSRA